MITDKLKISKAKLFKQFSLGLTTTGLQLQLKISVCQGRSMKVLMKALIILMIRSVAFIMPVLGNVVQNLCIQKEILIDKTNIIDVVFFNEIIKTKTSNIFLQIQFCH